MGLLAVSPMVMGGRSRMCHNCSSLAGLRIPFRLRLFSSGTATGCSRIPIVSVGSGRIRPNRTAGSLGPLGVAASESPPHLHVHGVFVARFAFHLGALFQNSASPFMACYIRRPDFIAGSSGSGAQKLLLESAFCFGWRSELLFCKLGLPIQIRRAHSSA